MAEILRKINVCPTNFNHKNRWVSGFFSDNKSTHVSFKPVILKSSSSYLSSCNFYGRRVVNCRPNGRKTVVGASSSQMRIGLKKVQGWWEKGHKTNMKEVEGPEDLVESLLNAGDKLVVVNFFSPGCGGCRALHPKICQLAEINPDVEFLQVNYEEHKSMCYALNVHVLPFFRFYRGAHGRLCSFSCTNATIKKFKDALAKHSPDRCSLGPTKGLEEKELAALAANKDLSFTYRPKPEQPLNITGKEISPAPASDMNLYPPLPLPRPLQPEKVPNLTKDSMNKTLAVSGR